MLSPNSSRSNRLPLITAMTNMVISKIGIEPPWNSEGITQHQKAFEKVKVRHPKINAAFERIHRMIGPHSGTNIVLLVGPTGVGKSTLAHLLEAKILSENHDLIEADTSLVPIVCVEAEETGQKSTPWWVFYSAVGRALNEPLMHRKVDTRKVDSRLSIVPQTTSDIVSLRKSVEFAMKERKTVALIIDEAAHLLQSNPTYLQKDFNALKSFCNQNQVTLIVVGSYDLFDILALSAQIMRRTQIVHVDRYMVGTPADELAFKKTLQALQASMPITTIPDLSKFAKSLQKQTLGCIGSLQETLARMLTNVLHASGEFEMAHLENALLTDAQLESMLAETLKGENMVTRHSHKKRLIAEEE
ncbi:TniB family NTP-binding protein [Janthinobacterium sp. Mn2066]|uniref:TniB family NTP-binding protein n=1 Tax=Janthinobacterium sp. Mn2066 TaxID=3395264 RepID=UPI003BDEAADC